VHPYLLEACISMLSMATTGHEGKEIKATHACEARRGPLELLSGDVDEGIVKAVVCGSTVSVYEWRFCRKIR
jgi:hypothetical protein